MCTPKLTAILWLKEVCLQASLSPWTDSGKSVDVAQIPTDLWRPPARFATLTL
jgi:hypothetical protein